MVHTIAALYLPSNNCIVIGRRKSKNPVSLFINELHNGLINELTCGYDRNGMSVDCSWLDSFFLFFFRGHVPENAHNKKPWAAARLVIDDGENCPSILYGHENCCFFLKQNNFYDIILM